MRLIEPAVYNLYFNTKEIFQIVEFDPDIIKELQNERFVKALSPVLDLCSYVSRLAIEEAKKGYSKRLEAQIRTEPVGALIRLKNPICVHIRDCATAQREVCTTRNISKKGIGQFPECWEYAIGPGLPDEEQIVAGDLSREIVHSWKIQKYVFIIEG